MNLLAAAQIVDIFPIIDGVFGFHSDWFVDFLPKMIRPAYLMMVLLLVISVGIMVLKRFDDTNLERKLWNIPVIITIIVAWPSVVLGIKRLVDTFNTFLIKDIFQFEWDGFGFPGFENVQSLFGWSAKAIVSILPSLSYWIIYSFFVVFFFLYAVLGPFVLAKGILTDEIDTFVELAKDLMILFLWQTMLVLFVAFIMPEIVSKKSYGPSIEASIFLRSIILSLLILFVPSMTRKFAESLGHSFAPPFVKAGAMLLGTTLLSKGVAVAGAPALAQKVHHQSHNIHAAMEFRKRYKHRQKILELEHQNERLRDTFEAQHDQTEEEDNERFIQLSKLANEELHRSDDEKQ